MPLDGNDDQAAQALDPDRRARHQPDAGGAVLARSAGLGEETQAFAQCAGGQDRHRPRRQPIERLAPLHPRLLSQRRAGIAWLRRSISTASARRKSALKIVNGRRKTASLLAAPRPSGRRTAAKPKKPSETSTARSSTSCAGFFPDS